MARSQHTGQKRFRKIHTTYIVFAIKYTQIRIQGKYDFHLRPGTPVHISKTNETVILWLQIALLNNSRAFQQSSCFFTQEIRTHLLKVSILVASVRLHYLNSPSTSQFVFFFCVTLLPTPLLPSTVGFSPKSNPWYLVFCLPFRKYFLQLQL